MSNIPISRPAQFGDRLYLNDQEHSQRKGQVERGVEQSENEADKYVPVRFRTSSLPAGVADCRSPNGVMPAVTLALRGARCPGTFGPGPLDWVTDFALRALHHAWHFWIGASRDLWQRQSHRAVARCRGDVGRDAS